MFRQRAMWFVLGAITGWIGYALYSWYQIQVLLDGMIMPI